MQPERRNVDQLHNNDMNTEKEKLERAFRLSVKQAEDASTSASQRCAKILEALHAFLTQWDALEEGEIGMEQEGDEGGTKQSRDLPRDYLNVVFCRMLSNLDPVKNVDTVREQILSILRSLQTAPCRQVFLDFLPAVTRVFVGSKNSSNAWTEGKSKRAKKQILSCLREVFENDPNSLSQLLRFFSSMLKDVLPRKHVIVSRDIFLFVVEGLPKVPETNLHVALRVLIRYVVSSDDARLAVDSVRTELALLEKTDISDMAPVATVFDEAVRGMNKNEELFVEEYFVVLEELVNEQKTKRYRSRHDGDRHVDDVENHLLTFDLVMMILLKDSIAYRDRILRMLSDGSLLQSGLLSGERVTRLVELAYNGPTNDSETTEAVIRSKSNPRTHLLESLADFSVSILLTPLHCTVEFDTKTFFSKIQVLLIDVVMKLPKEFQTKAIHIALRVADELMKNPEKSNTENASRDQLERKGKTRTKICLNVFLLLLSLVSREREILSPFQKHFVNYVTSESFDYLGKVDLLQTLCTIVAKAYFSSDSNGPLHSIAICRMLLFSSPSADTATTTTQIQAKIVCRRIRGMVFARAIISNCDLDSTLLVAMQKMASRVLLSPYSTIVMLDPRIGSRGMKLLRCMREQSNCDHSLGKDLFRVASLVLSHSRIVHYPDNPPKQSMTKSNSIFAYSDVPSGFPFDKRTEKQLRFRKMLFRFNYFYTNETLLNEPSSWERSSLWIFEVINTYLHLGRTVKWNPRAWIFAGIEFPGVSSSAITTRRKEKLSTWLQHHLSSFESSQNSRVPVSRMDKQISEVVKGAKTISEKEAIVISISRFALSLLFALSTSVAVLCNTYNHFEDLFEEGCDKKESNKKNEALQMIHYQFAKIYDIQQGCQSMERLFRNLGSRSQTGAHKRSRKTKKRRLNTPSAATEKTKLQIKAEMVALHLRESLSIILHYTESIPKKLFWICLTDQSHDKIVISAVKNLQNNETIEPILEVIQFRLNLIQHLGTIIPHALLADTEATLEKTQSRFQGSIVRCLCLTSFLLLNFSSLKRTTESDQLIEGLVKLISAYIRLACSILISIDYDQTSETNNRDASYIFGIYLSTFGSKQPLDRTIESISVNDSVNLEDFDKLVSSFQGHIGDHHTCITSQLLETLSIFAARTGSIILDRMIDINWSATFLSKYKNGESYMDFSGPPFALVEVFKSISRHKPQGFLNAPIEECCSHHVVTKLMKHRYSKSLERHQYLVQSMRRHWGLIALSSRRFMLIVNFLNTLQGKLTEYLKDVDDCLVEQNVDSKDNEPLPGNDDDDDDDDDEYLPPSTNAPLIFKPSIPTASGFACLTSESYPIYLDMLMRMTVSSIALFSIPEEISRLKQPATTSYRHHPVHELERMTIVYGELFRLYKDKFHIFPKFLHSSIINVSKCMLDVSVTKSQEYIEWRNCQPVLHFEEEKFKGFDVASTRFLKKLLNTFGLNVIGPLREFCSAHSRSTTIQRGRPTQIQKDNQFPTIPGLRQLERKCERTFVFFSQTSNRYGTGEVKTEDIVLHASQYEHDTSTKGSEEFSKTEQSTKEDMLVRKKGQESHKEIVNKLDSTSIRKKSSRRGTTPIQSVGNYDPSYSEDEESFIDDNDDSSSSTSDAFGVSGDWGQQIEDSAKEYDSEFFIDRFQKSS